MYYEIPKRTKKEMYKSLLRESTSWALELEKWKNKIISFSYCYMFHFGSFSLHIYILPKQANEMKITLNNTTLKKEKQIFWIQWQQIYEIRDSGKYVSQGIIPKERTTSDLVKERVLNFVEKEIKNFFMVFTLYCSVFGLRALQVPLFRPVRCENLAIWSNASSSGWGWSSVFSFGSHWPLELFTSIAISCRSWLCFRITEHIWKPRYCGTLQITS